MFQGFTEHTRIWIYTAERFLSDDEQATIAQAGNEFVASWASHGTPLKAAVQVLNNAHVIIAVDEAQAGASGCSIDKSMAFIQGLEKALSLSLTNRMLLVYKGKDGLGISKLSDLDKLFEQGVITEDTLIFDPLVDKLQSFQEAFQIPLKDSWAKRFCKL